ncbi:MAG: rubredoxin [Candidatus Ozemobacteraceae bacterium]
MEKFRCIVCGYVYDPAVGDPTKAIAAGTKFADLPESWVCPECNADKDQFEKV